MAWSWPGAQGEGQVSPQPNGDPALKTRGRKLQMALERARVLSLEEQEPELSIPTLCESLRLQCSRELLGPCVQKKGLASTLLCCKCLNEDTDTVPGVDQKQG